MYKKQNRNLSRTSSFTFGLTILLVAAVGGIFLTSPNAAAGPAVTPATV